MVPTTLGALLLSPAIDLPSNVHDDDRPDTGTIRRFQPVFLRL